MLATPAKKFTYVPDRHLTPPPAIIPQFLAFKSGLGITNSVLTHGLSYGADRTSLKSFVAELCTSYEGHWRYRPLHRKG